MFFYIWFCSWSTKHREICDKGINRFLAVLKFVPDWFVTSQMIKKVHNCLFTNEDSGNVTIFGGELGILDLAFYEDDPETVIHVIYIDNNAKHPNKS